MIKKESTEVRISHTMFVLILHNHLQVKRFWCGKKITMEVSWLGECVIKLIQWKYGDIIQLQDLQNLEYDPGGSFCRYCRVLNTYSNTIILLALSFAVVAASGQYVNSGVNPYTTNSSDLEPLLGTSIFADHELVLDTSLESISLMPMSAKIDDSSLYIGASLKINDRTKQNEQLQELNVSENSTSPLSKSRSTTNMSVEFEIGSTIVAIIVSMNDSQVPKFSNRTPHLTETESEKTGYFGVLSVVLGLMILLTIVGK